MTHTVSESIQSAEKDATAESVVVSGKPPRHVAIILDGNGRWAQRRGLPRNKGHEAGTENIRPIVSACPELGIEYLTLWAFSTENWRRPQDEVEGIFQILSERIAIETEALHNAGVRLRHIGSLEGLGEDLAGAVRAAIALTADNTHMTLTLAFNYGGRAEVVAAIQEMLRDGLDPESITEETVDRYLYTADMPDPDLIIRPSGEFRLSNFLIWQGAYAELYFPSILWPDFGPDDLRDAVTDFQKRQRRFGATPDPGSPTAQSA
ncbi:MAG: di-trans,poly-cis-decaprenylcistransferase [Thermomicrobia bacterium]|nr:di-trans,poly-cis-decaprenylcistransferase [Thermomicrobia bacterium]MCA1725202.1 di-trans,poly-cis-decaprenylcistransferase [Thermomicrobia bacterium]